jgi:hypothetical protein
VRREVVASDVRLDLHDPPDPAAGTVVADQPGADDRACGVERGTGQDPPIEDAQPPAG